MMDKPLVCGVGTYSRGIYTARAGGKHTREYHLWRNMLRRCYSSSEQIKCPTYKGCTVSENFKNFQYFAEWCGQQIGFENKDWHLDKDLLVRGNKEYSENTCVFVPRELNNLLTNRSALRGSYPVGVCWCERDKKFMAYLSVRSKRKHLGNFSTAEEAFSVHKVAKEFHVKDVATRYKDIVDPRVYEALTKWEVNVND